MKQFLKELFSAKGRINRKKFFVQTYILPIIFILIYWLIIGLIWFSSEADKVWYESNKSNLNQYVLIQETIWLSQDEIEQSPKYIELSKAVEEYENNSSTNWSAFSFLIIIIYITMPLLFYILIVAYIKRLHDLWKTWFYVFLNFIPLIGLIFSLYLLLKKWDEWTNKYGEDPLKIQETQTA